MKEQIVLLHGIWRTSDCLRRMQARLEQENYHVLNVDYPSVHYEMESLADQVWEQINNTFDNKNPMHFVGFSMGGLLSRVIIAKYKPKNLGNVVMLGTPNSGSELVDVLSSYSLFRNMYGPAGQQLGTQLGDLSYLKNKIHYPLGIIAGDLGVFPFTWMMLDWPNDGMVSVESTRMPGMADHLVIHAVHTLLPRNAKAIDQTVHFLKHQKFKH